MTKYKTNAQKLKFFNDAKAARMPKAKKGMVVRGFTTPGKIYDPNPKPTPPNPNEPKGPDPSRFYTNTTAGELANFGSPDTMYTNTTKGEISPVKPKRRKK
jgi:hypothetical protein